MYVLAVDTTSARGSLALLDDETVVEEVRVTVAEGHSRWLFPAIEGLLEGRGGPAALGAFAVTLGPGSFTGVRVGISTVQGLSLGTGKPCVGLSTLDVLATLPGADAGTVVALVDAWRGEVYARVYVDGRPQGPPCGGAFEEVAAGLPERGVFVGDGASRHAERLRALRPSARLLTEETFLAVPAGRMAQAVLRGGGGKGPEALEPLYIRGADIRLPAR